MSVYSVRGCLDTWDAILAVLNSERVETMTTSFGNWLRDVRQQRQISGKDLAQQTGIDASTISRLERGKTDPTLSTAVRLCRGMNIGSTDVYQALRNTHSSALLPSGEVENLDSVVTIQDVEDFVSLHRNDAQSSESILKWLLEQILALQESDMPKSERLLKQDTIYALPYPANIDPNAILEIYHQQGVLIAADVGTYLKHLRRSLDITLVELADILGERGPSQGALSRLENGLIENTTITEVIALDEVLHSNGIVFGMFWVVGELQSHILRRQEQPTHMHDDWTEEEFQTVVTFTRLCRWLQHYRKQDRTWLVHLRQKAQST